MCQEESLQSANSSSPVMLKLNLDIKMGKSIEEIGDEVEEPVSPPACDPEEGPPLLLSQSIEEIASEVVGENWATSNTTITEESDTDLSYIPKTVEKERRNSIGSLIPVTVSDFSEDLLTSPPQPPPTLHMSGGMVSTDMTLNMSSVPTSVITSNTYNNSVEPEVNNILQYFIEPVFPKNKDHKPSYENQKAFNPEMFPNLPTDLSITKVTKVKGQINKKTPAEDMNQDNRMQKIGQDETEMSFGVKRPRVLEIKDITPAKRKKKDTGSSLEIIPLTKTFVKDSPDLNCLDCKLILPRRKTEKAKIVFTNGMVVDIDRKVFNSLEQNILGKNPGSQTSSKKKVERAKVEKNDKKRKRESSNKKTKKETQNNVQISAINEQVLFNQQNRKEVPDVQDDTPKDMPMIVTSSNEDEEHSKNENIQKTEQWILPSNPTSSTSFTLIPSSVPLTIQTPFASLTQISSTQSPKYLGIPSPALAPTPPTETPPPSPPSPSYPASPTGLHKLPSIVSRPSYYTKLRAGK